MPKISVIVPVYKVEQYLDRCVESILAQTFMDVELILVDDGSPDNCPKMCDDWANKDDRIVVIHQENGGLSSARNAGINWAFENSSSEWLTFIDSDDWVNSNYIEILYNAAILHNSKLSQCMGHAVYSKDDQKESTELPSRAASPSEVFRISGAITAQQKLIHKTLMDGVRFPLGKLHEDEYTMYKVIFAVEYIALSPNVCYNYFIRDDSIMHSSYSLKKLDVIGAFEQQMSFFRKNKLNDMLDFTAASYIKHLATNYRQCRNIKFKKKFKTMMSLRFKLIFALFSYGRKLGLKIRTHAYIYESAFPLFMRIYWLVVSMKNKFIKMN